MTAPRFASGAKTAERVPSTTLASPRRTRHQASSRSLSVSPLCSKATCSPNLEKNRDCIAGVSAISGTSIRADRPRSRQRAIR